MNKLENYAKGGFRFSTIEATFLTYQKQMDGGSKGDKKPALNPETVQSYSTHHQLFTNLSSIMQPTLNLGIHNKGTPFVNINNLFMFKHNQPLPALQTLLLKPSRQSTYNGTLKKD